MSDIKIDKNIPIPERGNPFGLASIFKRLEVGDSFLWVPKSRANLVSSAKSVGIKIVTRKEGDGFRIWRRE